MFDTILLTMQKDECTFIFQETFSFLLSHTHLNSHHILMDMSRQSIWYRANNFYLGMKNLLYLLLWLPNCTMMTKVLHNHVSSTLSNIHRHCLCCPSICNSLTAWSDCIPTENDIALHINLPKHSRQFLASTHMLRQSEHCTSCCSHPIRPSNSSIDKYQRFWYNRSLNNLSMQAL